MTTEATPVQLARAAADTVRRLMFIEKLQQEIDEALLALEN